MKRFFNAGYLGGLTYIMLSSIIPPILRLTLLDSYFQFALLILILIFCALFIKRFSRMLTAQIVVTIFLTYLFQHASGASFLSWLTTFLRRSTQAINAPLNGYFIDFPLDLAYLFIAVVLLIAIDLIIRKRQWKLPFFILLGFFIVLLASNYLTIRMQMIQFLASSFLLVAWLTSEALADHQRLRYNAAAALTISLILVTSFSFITTLPNVQQQIRVRTNSLKNDLNSTVYEQLQRLRERFSVSVITQFSESDANLGGPVTSDKTVVFKATDFQSHYWKIDSKEIYTGTGWESNFVTDQRLADTTALLADFTQFKQTQHTVTFVYSNSTMTYLPLPYGKVTIHFENSKLNSANFFYSQQRQRIQTNQLNEDDLRSITYTYYEPNYTVEQLGNTSAVHSDPTYLQLPDALDERILQLAEQLTRGMTNDYEKVIAIQNYLLYNSAFSYSQANAEYTPQGEDYVAHFLFESKKGYCEHYSSAMAVLLRTLGISTRWVKGFNEGVLSAGGSSATKTYQIVNSDTHAWVEVYFAGVGWIPFEATTTFQLPNTIATNTPTPTQPGTQTPATQTPTTPQSPTPQTPDPDPVEPLAPIQIPTTATHQQSLTLVAIIILLGIAALIIRFRWAILLTATLIITRLNHSTSFQKKYLQLLRILAHIYPRPPAMDLHTYSIAAGVFLGKYQAELLDLTRTYQTMFYGQAPDQPMAAEQRRSYIQLLHRIYRFIWKRYS